MQLGVTVKCILYVHGALMKKLFDGSELGDPKNFTRIEYGQHFPDKTI